jgi:hypothetical protein
VQMTPKRRIFPGREFTAITGAALYPLGVQ